MTVPASRSRLTTTTSSAATSRKPKPLLQLYRVPSTSPVSSPNALWATLSHWLSGVKQAVFGPSASSRSAIEAADANANDRGTSSSAIRSVCVHPFRSLLAVTLEAGAMHGSEQHSIYLFDLKSNRWSPLVLASHQQRNINCMQVCALPLIYIYSPLSLCCFTLPSASDFCFGLQYNPMGGNQLAVGCDIGVCLWQFAYSSPSSASAPASFSSSSSAAATAALSTASSAASILSGSGQRVTVPLLHHTLNAAAAEDGSANADGSTGASAGASGKPALAAAVSGAAALRGATSAHLTVLKWKDLGYVPHTTNLHTCFGMIYLRCGLVRCLL